ncbi:hypothetical protein T11_10486 [Trichinella zimbabwensis]|uniref:Uncharacterized protein n=1 Tax=Trichinella zimbabwensis TaxID=268475 RepID=A0A0V1HXI8_9BILA|nr:hypothetical protein T11_10486 [Trichinella zimbabwensis]
MTRTSLRNQIAHRQWKTLNCQREQQINKKTFQNDNVAFVFHQLHFVTFPLCTFINYWVD